MTDLLTVSDLKIEFQINDTVVHAVDGASFRVPEGATVALVGESGSGKSVISQAIMGILPKPATITGGQILFRDPNNAETVTDIVSLDPDLRYSDGLGGNQPASARCVKTGRLIFAFVRLLHKYNEGACPEKTVFRQNPQAKPQPLFQ